MSFLVNLLFSLDRLGPEISFTVFKRSRHSSCWTFFWSIILLLAGLIWGIISILDYFRFVPQVYYDLILTKKPKEIPLNQFQILFTNSSNFNLTVRIDEIDGIKGIENIGIEYPMEPCIHGYNINNDLANYSEFIYSDHRYKYCINHQLYDKFIYNKEGFYAYSQLVIIAETKKERVDNLEVESFMPVPYSNHNNRKFPMSYQDGEFIDYKFKLNRTVRYDINCKTYEYETDNGIFFENIKTYKSLIKHDIFINNGTKEQDSSRIEIKIGTGQLNNLISYKYTRTYKRMQSIFAEITSMIDIFTLAASFIAGLVSENKMNNDLIKHILETKQKDFKENYNIHKEKKIEHFNSINNEQQQISNLEINYQKDQMLVEKLDYDIGIKTYKSSLDIFKSYFTCKEQNKKNKKFLELCNDVIENELSVETLFKKFDLIDNIYTVLPYEAQKKVDNIIPDKYSEIYEFIVNDGNPNLKEIFNMDEYESEGGDKGDYMSNQIV